MKIYNESERMTFKSVTIWYFILYIPYKIAQKLYLLFYKFGNSNFYRLMDFVERQRKISFIKK